MNPAGTTTLLGWLLFSVEPTDRALAGWCPVPKPVGKSQEAAQEWARKYQWQGHPMTGRACWEEHEERM